MSEPVNDFLFCVLSRSQCDYYENLKSYLNNKNIDVFVLKDDEHYDKNHLFDLGFKNLSNISSRFNSVTAWDKIFYHIYINNLLNSYKYFYIIEDDVYAKNIEYFYKLILHWQNYSSDLIAKKVLSKNSSPYWPYWKKYSVSKFKNPNKSLNPICRLSSGLVDHIIDYALQNNTFIFHEILFASLCSNNNLSIIDYEKLKDNNLYISNVVWHSRLLNSRNTQSNKIYHPNKNICQK